MTNSRTLRFVSCGIVLALLGTPTSTGLAARPEPADPAKSQPPLKATPSAPSTQPFEAPGHRVNSYAERISALGVAYDDESKGYIVRLPAAGPGSEMRPGVLAGFGVPVRLERSRWTKSAVGAALEYLKDRAWHPSARNHVYGFFFDPAIDAITLSTDASHAVIQPILSRFPGLISYNYRTGGGRHGRIDDTPPFWGGARLINSTFLRECTTGFTVQNSAGGRLLVTAGHCGRVYDSILNGNRTEFVGQVRGKAPFPQRDILFVGEKAYGAYIYVGGSAGAPMHVDGAGNPALGSGYCMSGSFTNETCGLTVRTLSGSLCDQYGCTHNVIGFTGAPRHYGDSGAPFYAYTTGRTHVHIRGMYIGWDGTYLYSEKWSSVAAFGYSIAR